MAERDELISALRMELIGPRLGLRESLAPPQHSRVQFVTPDDEYLCGVLAPKESILLAEEDADFELIAEQDERADDQTDPGAPVGSPGGNPRTDVGRSPALDPKSRPCSIGMSFLLAGENLRVDICATWAWYQQPEPPVWIRDPRNHISLNVNCSKDRQTIDLPEQDGIHRVQVEIRSRAQGPNRRVSIYLVNASMVARPRAADYVYQPQIRVKLAAGATLLPLDDLSYASDEDSASLALQYSTRRAFARGHLCAAVWNEFGIDPELTFAASASKVFHWIDGDQLNAADQQRFSPADVRTELLPCYLIQTPDFNACPKHGATEFNPEKLSELCNPTDLRAALLPLVDGYRDWITSLPITNVPTHHRQSAEKHKKLCLAVCDRMLAGIDKLAADPNALLAFNFANKAIAIQSSWTRGGKVVDWRPFQLAFQLLNIPAICDPQSTDRKLCDLLWVPTGGGKTEAYLGLAAFTFAFRRLQSDATNNPDVGRGVSVISRYTLRLLTIQQFRRAVNLLTACEMLRVMTTDRGPRGWRPKKSTNPKDNLWGLFQFSIGLWVGGNVTPNNLFRFNISRTERVNGALEILQGEEGEGEPAQVLKCPACPSHLALPPDLMAGRQITVHLTLSLPSTPKTLPTLQELSDKATHRTASGQFVPIFQVTGLNLIPLPVKGFYCLSLSFTPSRDARSKEFDKWCRECLALVGRLTRLVCARPSRPGYFLRYASFQGGTVNPVDFDIYCPNTECPLNTQREWFDSIPTGRTQIPEPFRRPNGNSSRIPIPALTVDDQVYQRCPSMLVATVDKFARLAFEPRAASIFGVVDHFCERYGYYRAGAPPNRDTPTTLSNHPAGVRPTGVQPFAPPDLILQDELHLIEGPLGSMVGVYEMAIEALCTRQSLIGSTKPKYIASSATVRMAAEQVETLYNRELVQFPPPAISVDDNFFATTGEAHQLDTTKAGRLYVGICSPGRGVQTPIVRIWARLLQRVEELRTQSTQQALDPYWTLVGYFNAIRELAACVALARQDIPEKMNFISPAPRVIPETEPIELSSRTNSIQLPGLLAMLEDTIATGSAINAVAATSMFGTGVDVTRLGLMVVHGQPKTTSSYIQATGRVGRSAPGLVATFYRAARPRDLSHYEFFVPYHRELYRHVEPVSVNPFSARARDRALGPVAVSLLRQALELNSVPVQNTWHVQQRYQQRTAAGQATVWSCSAHEMASNRTSPEVLALYTILRDRLQLLPNARQPNVQLVVGELKSEIERWAQLATLVGTNLLYQESSLNSVPRRAVVLGDLAHEVQGLSVAYENAPNSLREIEATTTFRGRA